MPGTRLLAAARRWFAPSTVSSVFEPLVADWQREWHDSAAPMRAWVTARGLGAFVCAAIVSSPHVLRAPTPSSVTNRVATRIAAFTLIASAILAIPIVMEVGVVRGLAGLLILPSLMTMTFPFAMVAAVDAIRRSEPLPEYLQRAAVVKLGLAALLLMIVFNGWVVPASNQVWRVAVSQQASGPRPGLRELSTYELIVDPARAAVPARHTRAGEIRQELNTRAVVALLPVLLLWLRWGGLEPPRRRWYWPLPASIATIAAIAGFFTLYFSGFRAEFTFDLLPGTGLWLPVLGLGAIGLVQQWWGSRPEVHA